ncbi:biotin/lipoyl-binding protein [bacterium]|nr:biotin/lipoyl-binding protein [bacterium]
MEGFSSVLINDESIQVNCRMVKEGDYLLTIGHNVYEVMFQEAMIGTAMEDEGAVITAPMPGLVAELHVALNDVVKKGQPLLILEAMKMQNELNAKSDGVVKELLVAKGDTVGIGQKLVVVEAE